MFHKKAIIYHPREPGREHAALPRVHAAGQASTAQASTAQAATAQASTARASTAQASTAVVGK